MATGSKSLPPVARAARPSRNRDDQTAFSALSPLAAKRRNRVRWFEPSSGSQDPASKVLAPSMQASWRNYARRRAPGTCSLRQDWVIPANRLAPDAETPDFRWRTTGKSERDPCVATTPDPFQIWKQARVLTPSPVLAKWRRALDSSRAREAAERSATGRISRRRRCSARS